MPSKGLHQATFAGTVGTDQGGIALGRQIKADVLHCHGALPADRQPADFENHFRHQPSLPSVLTPDQGAEGRRQGLAVAAHLAEVVARLAGLGRAGFKRIKHADLHAQIGGEGIERIWRPSWGSLSRVFELGLLDQLAGRAAGRPGWDSARETPPQRRP